MADIPILEATPPAWLRKASLTLASVVLGWGLGRELHPPRAGLSGAGFSLWLYYLPASSEHLWLVYNQQRNRFLRALADDIQQRGFPALLDPQNLTFREWFGNREADEAKLLRAALLLNEATQEYAALIDTMERG